MTTLAVHSDVRMLIKPEPRSAISIRVGVQNDFKFIDELHKRHLEMVGWMPRKALDAYIAKGHVLIAEEGTNAVGYCIWRDQYFKRDDVGIIYQLNIAPTKQRGLIGATLIKSVFERSAYGCKLYSCWCAQDLEANHFWESLGFVPLAFRAGSEKKRRVHIFWQKRIRAGDVGPASGGTPWWFPSKTNNGAIREDRLVLPIPPGTHWSDQMPMLLPGVLPGVPGAGVLPGIDMDAGRHEESKPATRRGQPPTRSSARSGLHGAKPSAIRRNGLRFAIPVQGEKPPETKPETKPAKAARVKRACDPRHVAAARELRDKYLEQVNSGALQLEGGGKYDVSRQLEAAPSDLKQTPLLKAA